MPAVYIATHLRDASASSWPVDVGDDPSFVASDRYRSEDGRLSWGVCRADIRNRIEPGDVVMFFAADRLHDRRPARYCFVGLATVDRKESQVELWKRADLAVYRRYDNLLVRPAGRKS